MVKALSESKVSKILTLCFQGFSQTEIANKLKITQPSVSIHVSKFKSLAEQQGIMAAAEEYGVMDQVTVLLDLAAELKKVKIMPEEVKNGLKLELLFQEYGVPQEEYGNLIETCEKLKNEDCFNAALELNKLEKGTGSSYAELVNKYKGFTDQLTQAHDNLENITAKISTRNEELADVNKQKKLADQDLKTHKENLGVDEQRLQLVETLALALKKAKIYNQELPHYIERQELLNKAEISIGVFADILGKSKVATLGDNGKKLLDLITECGSLVEAINKQQVKKQLLLNEVSNLEEQANLKGKLEVEIKTLKVDKAKLEGHITVLEKQEKNHTNSLQKKQLELEQLTGFVKQEQASLQKLKENRDDLEKEIGNKQTARDDLDGTINLKQQNVINLTQLETKHADLIKEIKTIETRLDNEKRRLLILDSFLGLIKMEPLQGIKKFASVLPALIADVEKGEFSPETLRRHVFKTMTGGTLKVWRCSKCGSRFNVDKPAPGISGYRCPVCGDDYNLVVDKLEIDILKPLVLDTVPHKIGPVIGWYIKSAPEKPLASDKTHEPGIDPKANT